MSSVDLNLDTATRVGGRRGDELELDAVAMRARTSARAACSSVMRSGDGRGAGVIGTVLIVLKRIGAQDLWERSRSLACISSKI
jgi:hypothetical protein